MEQLGQALLNPRKGTETWATYQGDFYAGKPAVIHRKSAKGTVTYIGVDSRSGEMENKVLSKLYGRRKSPSKAIPKASMSNTATGLALPPIWAKNHTKSVWPGRPMC